MRTVSARLHVKLNVLVSLVLGAALVMTSPAHAAKKTTKVFECRPESGVICDVTDEKWCMPDTPLVGWFILDFSKKRYFRCLKSQSSAECRGNQSFRVTIEDDAIAFKITGPQLMATIEKSGSFYSDCVGKGFGFWVAQGTCQSR